jgi:hypothetical protein
MIEYLSPGEIKKTSDEGNRPRTNTMKMFTPPQAISFCKSDGRRSQNFHDTVFLDSVANKHYHQPRLQRRQVASPCLYGCKSRSRCASPALPVREKIPTRVMITAMIIIPAITPLFPRTDEGGFLSFLPIVIVPLSCRKMIQVQGIYTITLSRGSEDSRAVKRLTRSCPPHVPPTTLQISSFSRKNQTLHKKL